MVALSPVAGTVIGWSLYDTVSFESGSPVATAAPSSGSSSVVEDRPRRRSASPAGSAARVGHAGLLGHEWPRRGIDVPADATVRPDVVDGLELVVDRIGCSSGGCGNVSVLNTLLKRSLAPAGPLPSSTLCRCSLSVLSAAM